MAEQKNYALTIAIPTYNRLEKLKICLKRLMEQKKIEQIEIIVSDNASSDGTGEYMTELVKKAENISYYRNTERVLGNFDEKSLVKKAIGGIIGAVIVCLSLGISGNLEEPVLYFFFSFWLAVGIIYGVNVIRSIMSGCYMTEDFMAKWLVLGVALIIGVIAGGILFAIDIVRWVVYLVAKKKEEK